MNYGVEMNKPYPPPPLNGRNSYLELLKYHLVFVLLPVFFMILIFFSKINTIIGNIYFLYSYFTGEEREAFITTVITIIKLLGMIFLNGFMISCCVYILKAGLQFMPYLSLINKLGFKQILLMSFKKFFPVLLLNFIVGFLITVFSSILMLIPIINFFSALIVPYLTALFVIYKEYLFASNLLNGRKLLSYPVEHFKYLFGQNKQFLLYAAGLALSYYVFLFASLFVKPFIQVKIIELFQPKPLVNQNYERTYY